MDPRREHLARLVERRHRRVRLLLACLVTAGACGFVAGLAAPQILVGSVAGLAAPAQQAAAEPCERLPGPMPLALSDGVQLDPREAQANAIRWTELAETDKRAALDRYWRLAEMDEAERQTLFDRYGDFRSLPEVRQAFLRDRARQLREFMNTLSPQDQAVLEGMNDTERAKRLLELWKARYGTW
jgi:hypothetical protein